MPKHQLNRTQRFDFTVKTVKAFAVLPGDPANEDHFEVIGEFKVSHIADAKDAADRLQEEFDADGDPCRTYVYSTGPVPIYAGLARYSNGRSNG